MPIIILLNFKNYWCIIYEIDLIFDETMISLPKRVQKEIKIIIDFTYASNLIAIKTL